MFDIDEFQVANVNVYNLSYCDFKDGQHFLF